MRRENRNAPDFLDLFQTIPDDRDDYDFVFSGISRLNLGRSGNSKIPDRTAEMFIFFMPQTRRNKYSSERVKLLFTIISLMQLMCLVTRLRVCLSNFEKQYLEIATNRGA